MALSFSRRSAISWFSSGGAGAVVGAVWALAFVSDMAGDGWAQGGFEPGLRKMKKNRGCASAQNPLF
jgi:hypothetical protein